MSRHNLSQEQVLRESAALRKARISERYARIRRVAARNPGLATNDLAKMAGVSRSVALSALRSNAIDPVPRSVIVGESE